MRARIGATLAMLATIASLQTPSAHARGEPTVVVTSFFSALNAGDYDGAVATFSSDATATLVRGETYRDPAGFGDLVNLMEHPGRRYEIAGAQVDGDVVTLHVEVSDHGIRWGEETIVATVQGGKLHTFEEKVFRLRIGS